MVPSPLGSAILVAARVLSRKPSFHHALHYEDYPLDGRGVSDLWITFDLNSLRHHLRRVNMIALCLEVIPVLY